MPSKPTLDAMHMAVMNQKVQKKAGGGDLKKAMELWNIAKGTRAKAAQQAAGLYHPIGAGVKLQTPVPFMEFKTIEDPTIKKAARKIISPEQLQGGIAIPFVGDRAAAGRILTDIGGQKLARPITLEGGPEYMLTHTSEDPNKSAIWASGKSVISELSDQAKIAGETGKPVYGVNVIGSPENVDFNTMTTEAILSRFDPSSLTKKARQEFTRTLRTYVPDRKKPHIIPGKNFVGLDDVDAMREQLMAPNAGELRKAFVNRMGTAKFRDMGFPDVPHARLAVTEPSLVESPLGSAGFTIGRLDPTGKIIEAPLREHQTYPVALGGQYEGSLESLVPYKQFFPSFEEKRRLLGARPSSDYRSFSMSPVFQELDQQWLDSVMKAMGKDKPSVSEFKDGGIAHMKDGDLVEDLIKEAKSKQEAPVNPFRMPTQKQSQYEKDFRQYLANQQAAREQVATELPSRLVRGAIPGAAGAIAGYAAQIPGTAGDIASLYQELKPESWRDLPDVVQALPTTERIQQYFLPEEKTSPELQAGITGGNIAALGQGIASLPAAAKGIAKGATAGSKALANEAAYRIYQAVERGEGALAPMLAGVAPKKMIPPSIAESLSTKRALPEDDLFKKAIENTSGAKITDQGVIIPLERRQVPEQIGEPSVRGGVFYLPEGSEQMKYYTGRGGYGGKEKISGETLISNPLFVKGSTGGKAPEAAYDKLLGKGAYQKMRTDALHWIGGPKDVREEAVTKFLNQYAPEMADQAWYILQNSKQGNQLAYALQEAAVGSAARKAGYDAILGYGTSRKTKQPFISEVFDVREINYPAKGMEPEIWPEYKAEGGITSDDLIIEENPL